MSIALCCIALLCIAEFAPDFLYTYDKSGGCDRRGTLSASLASSLCVRARAAWHVAQRACGLLHFLSLNSAETHDLGLEEEIFGRACWNGVVGIVMPRGYIKSE